MNRREFLWINGLFLPGGMAGTTRLEAAGSSGGRTFTLWPLDQDSGLQSYSDFDNRIYYLQANRKSGSYYAGAVDGEGKTSFRFRLPERQYFFLGVLPDGNLLLQRPGAPLEVMSERGNKLSEWPVQGYAITQCMAGGKLVRVLASGETETLSPGQSQGPRSASTVPWLSSERVALEAISPEQVVAFGRETARLALLHVSTGAWVEHSISASEVNNSLAHYARLRKEAAKTGKPLNTITVQAMGVDRDSRLLIMVSPYRVEAAQILRIDTSGTVLDSQTITLPGRHSPGFKIPWRIASLTQGVCVVFLEGGVICNQI